MKIATLQFAPQLGDVKGNIKRADAVLKGVEETYGDRIRGLDLLVLPEMAFSGYNFASLKAIQPYLEPTTAGPSANWARATARRLGCVVCVGYPEIYDAGASQPGQLLSKKDVEAEEPESKDPKRFNSLFIVDPSGDMLLNYQKRFLYYTDEPWALEGENGKGFFSLPVSSALNIKEPSAASPIPSLSTTSGEPCHIPTAVGICMDINPYKFTAPYSAYEFATHVLESGSKLVVLSMAWLTLLTSEELSNESQTPDTDTFRYWIKRFWPLIVRDDWDGKEIIIVCANRVGEEEGMEGKDTARYAGTSCVMAIRKTGGGDKAGGDEDRKKYFDAEVVVWERLGRAEEGVCFVDTDLPPKMAFRVLKAQDE